MSVVPNVENESRINKEMLEQGKKNMEATNERLASSIYQERILPQIKESVSFGKTHICIPMYGYNKNFCKRMVNFVSRELQLQKTDLYFKVYLGYMDMHGFNYSVSIKLATEKPFLAWLRGWQGLS